MSPTFPFIGDAEFRFPARGDCELRNEYRYAWQLAAALRDRLEFRSWFLAQTEFSAYSHNARLLDKEQKDARSPSARNWYGSYWVGSSYRFFAECGERETDLLALFEAENGIRFALHVEIKAPGIRFSETQARDYPRRAACWAGKGRNPGTVLEHDEATTVLCCERSFIDKHANEALHFANIVTFEEIAKRLDKFPDKP